MNKIKKYYFFFFFFFFLCFNSHALNRLEVKERVEARLSNVIKKIISTQSFIVNVKVETKKYEKKEAIASFENGEQQNKDYGDFLLLKKLGLEKRTDLQQRKELKETYEEKAFIEFNQDSFIDKINVEVYVDTLISDDQFTVVKQALERVTFLKTVTNSIIVKRLKLSTMSKDEIFEAAIYDFLRKNALALGIIIAAFVFTFGFFVISRKIVKTFAPTKVDSDIDSHSSISNDLGKIEGDDSEKSLKTSNVNKVQQLESIAEESAATMERFKKYLEVKPVDASTTIRIWLHSEEKKPILNFLAQELDQDRLEKIFENLSINERTLWKQALASSVTAENITEILSAINEQVLSETISANYFVDSEFRYSLSQLKPQQCVSYLRDNFDKAGILMNILSPSFLSETLSLLSNNDVEMFMKNALLDDDFSDDTIAELKHDLLSLMPSKNSTLAFVKLKELLLTAKLGKELPFYLAYAQEVQSEDLLVSLMRNQIPAFIMNDLPNDVLKEILMTYKRDKLLDYLVLQSEEKLNKFLGVVAEKGSKMREIISFELNARKSEGVLDSLYRRKANVELNYYEHVQNSLKNSSELVRALEPVFNEWASKLIEIESLDENDNDNFEESNVVNEKGDDEESDDDNIIEFDKIA